MDEKDKDAKSRDLVTLGDGETGRATARQELMQRIEDKFRDYGASVTPFLALSH